MNNLDPGNAIWKRDLSASLNNIGRIYETQGKLAEALLEYDAFKSIVFQLTQDDPSNADWQRELLVSHICFGQILMKQGKLLKHSVNSELV